MFGPVPPTDDRERLRGEVVSVIELAFDEGSVAFAGAADVAAGLGGVEGKFLGDCTHDWACMERGF